MPGGESGILFETNDGDHVNVKSKLVYTLTFYNVGQLGGDSFTEATLQEDTIALDNGVIVVMKKKEDGTTYKTADPAPEPPVFKPRTWKLKFSGGPYGTFTDDKNTVVGNMVNDGKGIHFTKYVNGLVTLQLDKPAAFDDWLKAIKENQPEDSGARFSSLSGQVEVRPDLNPKGWTFAKMNTVLYVDDHVKTDEDSNAIIGYADLSTFLLKPESEIVITTPPKKDSKIDLVIGKIMVNVKKMMKDGTMEIDTSQAVLGIKGTVFEAESNATSSTVRAIYHDVTLTSKSTGNTVTITPGQMVTATAAGLGQIETFNVTAEEKLWGISLDSNNDIISSTPTGRNSGSDPSTTPKSDGFYFGSAILPLLATGIILIRGKTRNN